MCVTNMKVEANIAYFIIWFCDKYATFTVL